ncbi:MAG: hypothetical protein AAF403_09220, partial [Pseudomonadota bacterium]
MAQFDYYKRRVGVPRLPSGGGASAKASNLTGISSLLSGLAGIGHDVAGWHLGNVDREASRILSRQVANAGQEFNRLDGAADYNSFAQVPTITQNAIDVNALPQGYSPDLLQQAQYNVGTNALRTHARLDHEKSQDQHQTALLDLDEQMRGFIAGARTGNINITNVDSDISSKLESNPAYQALSGSQRHKVKLNTVKEATKASTLYEFNQLLANDDTQGQEDLLRKIGASSLSYKDELSEDLIKLSRNHQAEQGAVYLQKVKGLIIGYDKQAQKVFKQANGSMSTIEVEQILNEKYQDF